MEFMKTTCFSQRRGKNSKDIFYFFYLFIYFFAFIIDPITKTCHLLHLLKKIMRDWFVLFKEILMLMRHLEKLGPPQEVQLPAEDLSVVV